MLVAWMLDGRYVKLAKPFSFIDSQGHEWVAHKGLISDGATIPRAVWPIIGGPFEGKYRRAAIIHDAAYESSGVMEYGNGCFMKYTRAAADRALYEAMVCDGLNRVSAAVIYGAVRLFGHIAWESDRQRKERQ